MNCASSISEDENYTDEPLACQEALLTVVLSEPVRKLKRPKRHASAATVEGLMTRVVKLSEEEQLTCDWHCTVDTAWRWKKECG